MCSVPRLIRISATCSYHYEITHNHYLFSYVHPVCSSLDDITIGSNNLKFVKGLRKIGPGYVGVIQNFMPVRANLHLHPYAPLITFAIQYANKLDAWMPVVSEVWL